MPAFQDFIKSEYSRSPFLVRAVRFFSLSKQIHLQRPGNPFVSSEKVFEHMCAILLVPADKSRWRPVISAQFDTVLVVEDPKAFARWPKGSLQDMHCYSDGSMNAANISHIRTSCHLHQGNLQLTCAIWDTKASTGLYRVVYLVWVER